MTWCIPGRLYARLHRTDVSWFDPVRQQLVKTQTLTAVDGDWAFCLWVLPRLQRLVPEENAKDLAAQGASVHRNFDVHGKCEEIGKLSEQCTKKRAHLDLVSYNIQK